MKKPQIDLFSLQLGKYMSNLGFKNKFLRLWGHNGETLNERVYYYPNHHLENNAKLFRLLNIYKDLEEGNKNMKGVESAWLYLNPDKIKIEEYEADMVANKLNARIEYGTPEEFDIQIVLRPLSSNTSVFSKPLSGTINEVLQNGTEEEKKEYILNNWEYIFNNYTVIGDNKDATSETISKYIFFDNENDFNIGITHVANKAMPQTSQTKSYDQTTNLNYYETVITVDFTVTRVSVVEETNTVVQKIVDYQNEVESIEQKELNSFYYSQFYTDEDIWGERKTTNEIFLENKMRKSIFEWGNGFKSKEVIEVIKNAIDNGYQKEKVSWWKKLLAIILIVVLFVMFRTTFGLSITSALAATSVAVSIAAYAAQSMGEYGLAATLSEFGKVINFASMAMGIGSMLQGLRTGLMNASKTIALENGLSYASGSITMEGITKYVQDAVTNSVTNLSFKSALSMVTRVSDFIFKNKMQSMEEALKAKQGELQAQQDQLAEEESRNRDLALLFVDSYSRPMEQDQGPYNFDYPYEQTTKNVSKQFFPTFNREEIRNKNKNMMFANMLKEQETIRQSVRKLK